MLQCEIIGNIGNDAEIKKINGKENVSFNVAHSERYNGTENTTWVSVLMGGNGGNLVQYLKKGEKVFVRGRLSVNQYQDKNGQWRVGLNIYATEIQLCGSKKDSQNDTPFGQPLDNAPY